MRTTFWQTGFPILVLVAAALASLAVYPHLAPRVPIHWNLRGDANGWTTPVVGAWALPLLMLVMWGVLRAAPLAAGRGAAARLGAPYNAVVAAVLAGLLGVHLVILAAGTGHAVHVTTVILLLLACQFVVIGRVLPHTTPNRWVGIRTRATLADPVVWSRTQRIAGTAFVVAGTIIFAAAWLPPASAVLVSGLVTVTATAFPLVYSARQT